MRVKQCSICAVGRRPRNRFGPFIFNFLCVPFVPFVMGPYVFTLLKFRVFPRRSSMRGVKVVDYFTFFRLFPGGFKDVSITFVITYSLGEPTFFMRRPSRNEVFRCNNRVQTVICPFIRLNLG